MRRTHVADRGGNKDLADVLRSPARGNAYYSAAVADFLSTGTHEVLGALVAASAGAVDPEQRDAWVAEIDLLQSILSGVTGQLLLEFDVPRIGSRIDAVLISGPAIIVIEFKVGAKGYNQADIDQVWDYALDLKNFHKASHDAAIFPILVATEAPSGDWEFGAPYADRVYAPAKCGRDGLLPLIQSALAAAQGPAIDPLVWARARYEPTPTIVEAAQALYARHSVEAISRSDAGAINLRVTSRSIESVIESARQSGTKAIVFVTGVPGAGKTLVGLNVATQRRDEASPTHAVYLSGNGPLVAVLREALTRDELQRLRAAGHKKRKGEVGQGVKAFIQNVHHFRDAGVRDLGPPVDHVVIFDEAQRAWNRDMTSDFMRRKKGLAGFDQSEPEFLLSYMDRHHDWAVVVCLVGGGQEINRGEAGISAWLEALCHGFPYWQVFLSPELVDREYAAGHALEKLKSHAQVQTDRSLHLSISMRSFRAENVASFVKAVLDCEVESARSAFEKLIVRYPIALTRDLPAAKAWIRTKARGSERVGLVASSGAERLRPHAVDVRVKVDPVQWFLNPATDTRSSQFLEDAATEFQVQGLEVDWACVTWDADLRFARAGWQYHSFRGSQWIHVSKPERQQYLLNAYRVLLTRARQGMVIFVPKGDERDHTRRAAFYDSTFEYLHRVGIPVL